MIVKREEEIETLQNIIEESRQFDEVSRQKRDNLKSTAYLLEEILSESKISDANLRILVRQIYVYQNEDKSLDVRFEFNGDFEDSSAVYIRPVLKPPKHRLTCLFCVMLCQFSLKYIQYSCGKLILPDTKNPASFGTSTVLEQVY